MWKFISAENNDAWLKHNGDFGGRSRFQEYTIKVWPSRFDGSD